MPNVISNRCITSNHDKRISKILLDLRVLLLLLKNYVGDMMMMIVNDSGFTSIAEKRRSLRVVVTFIVCA